MKVKMVVFGQEFFFFDNTLTLKCKQAVLGVRAAKWVQAK